MPSVYQLIPPKGAPALLDASGAEIDADLHDIATWERFGWGPFGSTSMRRLSGLDDNRDRIGYDEFLAAVLARARDFHRALVRRPLVALSHQGDRARAATACRRWPAASCRRRRARSPASSP